MECLTSQPSAPEKYLLFSAPYSGPNHANRPAHENLNLVGDGIKVLKLREAPNRLAEEIDPIFGIVHKQHGRGFRADGVLPTGDPAIGPTNTTPRTVGKKITLTGIEDLLLATSLHSGFSMRFREQIVRLGEPQAIFSGGSCNRKIGMLADNPALTPVFDRPFEKDHQYCSRGH
jgi:hypothetical protein